MAQLRIQGRPIIWLGELFSKEMILVVKPSPTPSILRYHDYLNLIDLGLMAKFCGYESEFDHHEQVMDWFGKEKKKRWGE